MQEKQLKIIYFGTSDFAVPALESLVNFGYKIEAVVTQPEKPVGRAKVIMPSPVKKKAIELGLQVFEPHNLKNDEEFMHKFKHIDPDFCVVASYGKIIPDKYLSLPKYGFLNIHPSLLPKYRGPSPIQTAVINGDLESGVTIMKMDDQVDHGPILSSKPYYLLPTTYYSQAEEDLAKLGSELLIETIPRYINGDIKSQEQDHSQATFTKKFTREDGRIDWNRTADEIYNQVRVLNPEPGTWTKWKNKVLNIKSAEVLKKEAEDLNIGKIIKIDNAFVVVAKRHCLVLKKIQLEGRKEIDVRDFINGHPDLLNSQFE